MRVVSSRVWSRSAVEGLSNITGLVVLAAGTLLALDGRWGLSPGSLAAFITVMMTTQRTSKELTKSWTQLQDALPSAERYFELLDTPSETADAADAVRIDGIREGIRITKVSFSYGREPVLRDVSLDVRAGEVVALVGRTGSGKTTLADLLLRFYEPQSGSIEIDGVDLRRISRDALLEQVAVVSQEPVPVRRHDPRQHPLRAPGRERRRAPRRRARRLRGRVRQPRCRRATTRPSATPAPNSRAASASASRSRARC